SGHGRTATRESETSGELESRRADHEVARKSVVLVTGPWIAAALDQLRAHISAGNQKGNVEGLLARYLVAGDSRLDLQWTVDCDGAWIAGVYDPSNLGHVAALAYTVAHTGSGIYRGELEAGLRRAAAR